MKVSSKLGKLAGAALIVVGLSQGAAAVDQDIGATATFRQALAIANPIDMAFGTIEYAASAGAEDIVLAPDGSLTCNTNTTDYTCSGTGTAGSFDLSGEAGAAVNIRCDATGTLANTAGSVLLSITSAVIDGGDSGNATCTGTGNTVDTFTLTGGADSFTLGATIDTGGTPQSFAYSTANTNGDPINVDIVYQ